MSENWWKANILCEWEAYSSKCQVLEWHRLYQGKIWLLHWTCKNMQMCKMISTNLFGAGADLKRFYSNFRHFYAILRHIMRSFVVKFSRCNFFQVLMIVNAFCMSVPNVGFQNDESKSLAQAGHVVPVQPGDKTSALKLLIWSIDLLTFSWQPQQTFK